VSAGCSWDVPSVFDGGRGELLLEASRGHSEQEPAVTQLTLHRTDAAPLAAASEIVSGGRISADRFAIEIVIVRATTLLAATIRSTPLRRAR
jgi:hypothetical protein